MNSDAEVSYNLARQGKLIVVLNDAQKQALPIAQLDNKKEENLTCTTRDSWAASLGKGIGVLQVPDREQKIKKAAKVPAEHVKQLEVCGEEVAINNTNVVDNVLLHNWGQLWPEEFGQTATDDHDAKAKTLADARLVGRSNNYNTTVGTATKAQTLQDVRAPNGCDNYNALKDKVRQAS